MFHLNLIKSLEEWEFQWPWPSRSCSHGLPWRPSQPSLRPRWAASWPNMLGAARLRRLMEWKYQNVAQRNFLKLLTPYLILCSLVSVPSLVTPPDSYQQSCPSAGLQEILNIKGVCCKTLPLLKEKLWAVQPEPSCQPLLSKSATNIAIEAQPVMIRGKKVKNITKD